MSREKIGKILVILGVLMVITAPLVYWQAVLYPLTLPRTAWVMAAAPLFFLALFFGWQKNNSWQLDWFDLAALLWLGLLVISSLFAADPHTAWWSEAGRMIGVVWLVMWFGSYLAARQFFWTEKERRTLAIISPLIILVAIIGGVLLFSNEGGARAAGLFGNPVVYGTFLQLAFFWLILLWWQKEKLGLNNWWWRGVVLFTAAATLVVLWQTDARSAIAGCVGGILFGLVGYQWQKQQPLVRAASIIGAVLILIVVGMVVYEKQGRASSITARWNNWRVATHAIVAKPILGWGWDNYRLATEKLFDPQLATSAFYETRIDKPHNIFLEMAVSGGFLGLTAYILMWLVLWWKWRTNFKRGFWSAEVYWTYNALLVGYFITQFFNFDTTASLVWWWIFWLWSNTETSTNLTVRVAPIVGRLLVFILLVLSALATWYGGYLPLRQGMYIDEARYAAGQKNLERVEEMFRLSYATPAGPYPFEQWRWLADSILSGIIFSDWQLNSFTPAVQTEWLADRDKIAAETTRLLVVHSDSILWQLFGGRINYYLYKAGAGDQYLELADNAFQRSHELVPENPEPLVLSFTIALERKQIDRAVELLQQALTSYAPDTWNSLDKFVPVLQQEKRITDIVSLYEVAVRIHPTADMAAKLAAAYAMNKQVVKAREAVALAVQLDPGFAAEAEQFLQKIK